MFGYVFMVDDYCLPPPPILSLSIGVENYWDGTWERTFFAQSDQLTINTTLPWWLNYGGRAWTVDHREYIDCDVIE